MQAICDLYFDKPTVAQGLKLAKVFDKAFTYVPGFKYSGYVGLNIERIKMVSVVTDLRRVGVEAYSAPVRYRDLPHLSPNQAHEVALKYALASGVGIENPVVRSPRPSPVVWMFRVVNDPHQRIGGVVMVDRLDGHRWTSDEYAEYLYDYNNMI